MRKVLLAILVLLLVACSSNPPPPGSGGEGGTGGGTGPTVTVTAVNATGGNLTVEGYYQVDAGPWQPLSFNNLSDGLSASFPLGEGETYGVAVHCQENIFSGTWYLLQAHRQDGLAPEFVCQPSPSESSALSYGTFNLDIVYDPGLLSPDDRILVSGGRHGYLAQPQGDRVDRLDRGEFLRLSIQGADAWAKPFLRGVQDLLLTVYDSEGRTKLAKVLRGVNIWPYQGMNLRLSASDLGSVHTLSLGEAPSVDVTFLTGPMVAPYAFAPYAASSFAYPAVSGAGAGDLYLVKAVAESSPEASRWAVATSPTPPTAAPSPPPPLTGVEVDWGPPITVRFPPLEADGLGYGITVYTTDLNDIYILLTRAWLAGKTAYAFPDFLSSIRVLEAGAMAIAGRSTLSDLMAFAFSSYPTRGARLSPDLVLRFSAVTVR